MSFIYDEASIGNIIYNSLLELKIDIKVNKKKNERKFNDDLRLLISEILYIVRYVKYDPYTRQTLIIYIGAGPGFHLVKLMKMFPFISFDLYDDKELHVDLEKYIIENTEQVNIYREKFTLETCSRYENKNDDIYLITDFKDVKFMVDPPYTNDGKYDEIKREFQREKELSYAADMELQKNICISLNPINAFLRFRPTHYYLNESPENAIFEYFNGTIYLMIYNDYKSTESRLVVDDFNNTKFKWNYKDYQYRLNYFNDIKRESLLKNPFTNDNTPLPNQGGNKFEFVMMFYIILEYFSSIGIKSPRITDIFNFYINFLVVETCSKIPNMFKECAIEDNTNEDGPSADLYEEN